MRTHAGKRAGCITLFCLMICALLICSDADARGGPQQWRFGTGVATQNMVDGTTTTNLPLFDGYKPGDTPWNPLGLGWYFNWNWRHGAVSNPATGETIPYMPLVGGWSPNVSPTITTIRNHVNANPALYPDGTIWLIGNEIIWDDQRTPLKYAQDYHTYYHGIKSINPTFKIAFGAIITSVYYNRAGFTGTPLDLCDAIRAAYQSEYGVPMPVDVWRIHPYVWTMPTIEDQLAYFEQMLRDFRAWMASVGEQDKPLIITEYGLLNYHSEQHITEYMLRSFEILLKTNQPNGMPSDEGRLVQQWAWFVNNNHVWETGGAVQWTHCALYNGDTFDIRPLGIAYSNHPKEPNAVPAVGPASISSNMLIADGTTPYTITVTASDGNGVDHIRDIRAMLHNGGSFGSSNARGYLVWAETDSDITRIGGSWTLMGDASGGGRWGYCSNDWGGSTYITPISASTEVVGGQRVVTFTFAVKPAWTLSGNQRMRTLARDRIDASVGWVESTVSYETVPFLTLGDVHNNPDGTNIQIPCGVVTAGSDQFASTFYVQALDRSSGIKVYSTTASARAGDLVSLTGRIQTQYGERTIVLPVFTVHAANTPVPDPLFVTGRGIGGESPNAYTLSVYGGRGLYNVGLLVRIFGRVTQSDSSLRYFYVDDGSGRDDESGYLGIKVNCSGLAAGNAITVPPVGSYVIVTGIISAQTSAGKVIPMLRPRTQSDVNIVAQ